MFSRSKMTHKLSNIWTYRKVLQIQRKSNPINSGANQTLQPISGPTYLENSPSHLEPCTPNTVSADPQWSSIIWKKGFQQATPLPWFLADSKWHLISEYLNTKAKSYNTKKIESHKYRCQPKPNMTTKDPIRGAATHPHPEPVPPTAYGLASINEPMICSLSSITNLSAISNTTATATVKSQQIGTFRKTVEWWLWLRKWIPWG